MPAESGYYMVYYLGGIFKLDLGPGIAVNLCCGPDLVIVFRDTLKLFTFSAE